MHETSSTCDVRVSCYRSKWAFDGQPKRLSPFRMNGNNNQSAVGAVMTSSIRMPYQNGHFQSWDMLNDFTQTSRDAWHPGDYAIHTPVLQQNEKQHHSINGEYRGNIFAESHLICCWNELQGQREAEGHYRHGRQEYCPTFQDTLPRKTLSSVTDTRMSRTRQCPTEEVL